MEWREGVDGGGEVGVHGTRGGIKGGTCSSATDAPLTSTPTVATASSVAASSLAASSLGGRSFWYMPTPRADGSILSSSERGSTSRRAIETAARCCRAHG